MQISQTTKYALNFLAGIFMLVCLRLDVFVFIHIKTIFFLYMSYHGIPVALYITMTYFQI